MRDQNQNLRLVAYRFPERGLFMQERGTTAAGVVGDIDICRMGTEMVVTAVKDSSNHLKVMRHVTASGSHIFDWRMRLPTKFWWRCARSTRGRLSTALRDGGDNLKVIVWRLPGSFARADDFDKTILQLTERSAALEPPQTKADLARGGECDEER